MNKLSTLVWIVVIVCATFMLYKVKYQVQALKVQVAETTRELEREKQAIHVVAAEWAYLNRPERLQKLAQKYLPSTQLTVHQVADIQAIPFPGQAGAMFQDNALQPAAAHFRVHSGAPR